MGNETRKGFAAVSIEILDVIPLPTTKLSVKCSNMFFQIQNLFQEAHLHQTLDLFPNWQNSMQIATLQMIGHAF